ncbi:MAG TPA: hypothetical protein VFG01_11485 [Acidobacteriota bacterium]|nr:hypothetical protein [Acidobacteriota bacterium]
MPIKTYLPTDNPLRSLTHLKRVEKTTWQRIREMESWGICISSPFAMKFSLLFFIYRQEPDSFATFSSGERQLIGARERSILTLMSKDFLALIGAAAMMACPVTYFLLQGWLQNFAYRIELSILPFVTGTLITAAVIMGSILFKIMKTARTNPVEALRYE